MEELKKLLGEELFNQVTTKLGDKKVMIDNGNFIPKHRFDEVNEAKKDLEKQVQDRDKQLKDLSSKVKDNEELSTQLKKMQDDNKATKEQYESKIQKLLKDNFAENSLVKAGCKNVKATKAIIDNYEDLEFKDGAIEGFDNIVNGLKENASYLFEDSTPGNTGTPGSKKRTHNQNANPFAKDTFNLTEQGKLFKENPEKARELASLAGTEFNF